MSPLLVPKSWEWSHDFVPVLEEQKSFITMALNIFNKTVNIFLSLCHSGSCLWPVVFFVS